MIGKSDSNSVVRILTALGSSVRFELVNHLSRAETFAGLSLSELSKSSGLTRQTITKHLEALHEVGLVSVQKPGRTTWYEMKTEALLQAIVVLKEIVDQRARSEQSLKSALLRRNS